MSRISAHRLRVLSGTAALALLPLTLALPALAGSEPTFPNTLPPPPSPTDVVTSSPQLDTFQANSCQQQYINQINEFWARDQAETTKSLDNSTTANNEQILAVVAQGLSVGAAAANFILLDVPGGGVSLGLAAGQVAAEAVALGF